MPNFLKQLGNGFSFIDEEYKILIGNTINYIDKHLKRINQDKTIGIIVCKKDDKYLIEYSSDDRIRITTYELV